MVAKVGFLLYSNHVQKRQKTMFFHSLNQRSAFLLIGLLVFGIGLTATRPIARAYSEPTTDPTIYPSIGVDQFKFLNGSSNAQQKKGSLILGSNGGDASLCLNSQPGIGTGDTANCIQSWADIQSVTTGSQLELGVLGAGLGGTTVNYTRQTGFVRLRNDNDSIGVNKNQRYSLIVEANTHSSAVGATAVTAFDGPIGIPVSVNWAGYFSGQVLVGDSTWSSAKKFCLNETYMVSVGSTKGCIHRWIDFVFGTNGQSYLALSPATDQPGKVAVVGALSLATAQAGSVAGLPMAWTCGDGICSANTTPSESSSSCPIDCQSISPPQSFVAYSGNGLITLEGRGANLPNQTSLVILRKAGGAPTSQPTEGVLYSVGDTVGDATVAHVGTVAQNAVWNVITDTPLTNGQTYHYTAFQGNAFPRFSTAASSSAQATTSTFLITLAVNNPGSGTSVSMTVINGNGTNTSCSTSCQKAFSPGAVVRLQAQAGAGRNFTGWGGACGGAGTCTVTMSQAQSVSASFSGGDGGGPGGDPDIFD